MSIPEYMIVTAVMTCFTLFIFFVGIVVGMILATKALAESTF
jgi:hypothetical protein